MSKMHVLFMAEDFAEKHGSYAKFRRDYDDARQQYGIETSVEMALEAQGLLTQFQAFLVE